MYILILITSFVARFHHQIEIRSIDGLKTEAQCQALGKKLSAEIKQLNQEVEVKSFCEEGTK